MTNTGQKTRLKSNVKGTNAYLKQIHGRQLKNNSLPKHIPFIHALHLTSGKFFQVETRLFTIQRLVAQNLGT